MESSSLLTIESEIPVMVEEYEDDNLIRSYEYSDPTRSNEFTLSAIEKNEKFFGIYVSIYTRDEYDKNNPVNEPPHVHIQNLNKIFICKINISGDNPRTIEKMRPCLFKINEKLKKNEVSSLIPNMVAWADYNRKTPRGIIKNWDYAKAWWEKHVKTVEKL
jgi:hypothetical protein